jgi:hypothetical protein
MNLCRESVKMTVPPGNHRGLNPRRTFEQYVAGFKARGRPEGRSYPRSEQPIHELSGLGGRVEFVPWTEKGDIVIIRVISYAFRRSL